MILELKAKKTIKIGTNASIVPAQPAGDWTDTGNNCKARSSNDRKGTTATTTTTITTTASAITTTATTADSKQVAANATSANAVQRGSKDDPCALAQPQLAVQRSRVMKEDKSLPPVVAWEKAGEERQRKDDDDDWDKLPCNSNIVDSLPIPSKQPFQPTPDLARRQDATPTMSSRTSKRTIMSPLVSSLSSLEQVPFNPPGDDIICTINQLSQSAQSTGGEVAHVFKVRGLPGKVRSATLEDLNVNSKARFVIS